MFITILPMIGLELRTSALEATTLPTEPQPLPLILIQLERLKVVFDKHRGFVCAFNPAVPASNPNHTIYDFTTFVIVMRKGRK